VRRGFDLLGLKKYVGTTIPFAKIGTGNYGGFYLADYRLLTFRPKLVFAYGTLAGAYFTATIQDNPYWFCVAGGNMNGPFGVVQYNIGTTWTNPYNPDYYSLSQAAIFDEGFAILYVGDYDITGQTLNFIAVSWD